MSNKRSLMEAFARISSEVDMLIAGERKAPDTDEVLNTLAGAEDGAPITRENIEDVAVWAVARLADFKDEDQ